MRGHLVRDHSALDPASQEQARGRRRVGRGEAPCANAPESVERAAGLDWVGRGRAALVELASDEFVVDRSEFVEQQPSQLSKAATLEPV